MNWEPEWVETAHEIAKRMYGEVYAKKGGIPEMTADVVKPKVCLQLPSCITLHSPSNIPQKSNNIFDDLPSLATPRSVAHELETYLSSETMLVTDALKWWTANKAVYPCLSQMALDFLSIPGRFSCA